MSEESEGNWFPVEPAAAAEFDEVRRRIRNAVEWLPVPEPGAVIDRRFEVVRELGKGGFGVVFEVRHVHLEQRFALKLLTPEIAARPGWKGRFLEEARATSQIGHRNIVFITDFGECEKFGAYFAMEYLDGLSLEDVLKDEDRLAPAEAMNLVSQIASALDAVHERDVVHCDLKPANVFRLLGPNVRWKLLDFGASSLVMSAIETQTIYGTPRYMAPEHAMGLAVDRRADVFSLALLTYEALTGQAPWDIRMWYHATPTWRSERPPPPPSSLAPGLPHGWDAAILRGLAIEPDARHDRAGELAEELLSGLEARSPALPRAPALGPETVVERSGTLNLRASLSSGEFFILSRIEAGVTLGELSRLCTGLPFDVDATLESMIERGYVVPGSTDRPKDARRAPRPRATEVPQSLGEASEVSEPIDVDALLNHVRRVYGQGNFLGAMETLNTALVTWPRIAMLHHERGVLLREFAKPAAEVCAAFRRAVSLEPENGMFRQALADAERSLA